MTDTIATSVSANSCLGLAECGQRVGYLRGCHGDACRAKNTEYMAEWYKSPAGRRSARKQALKAKQGSSIDVGADSNSATLFVAVGTVALGDYIHSDLDRAAQEGFSDEYVRWLRERVR